MSTIVGLKLGENVLDARLDSILGDIQLLANDAIPLPRRYQAQDAHLFRAQKLSSAVLSYILCDIGVQVSASPGDIEQGPNDVIASRRLQQVGTRAHIERTRHPRVACK